MNIKVICIGSELLAGDTVNTNLAFSGQRLAEAGFAIHSEHCVPDDVSCIRQALVEALGNNPSPMLISGASPAPDTCVVTIGGLGPTGDDLTREAVAGFIGEPLVVDPRIEVTIRDFLQQQGRDIPAAAIRAQASRPASAEIIPNSNGTAPGLCVRLASGVLFMLPGPPREYCPMFEQAVLPELSRLAPPDCHSETIRICGIPESRAEAMARKVIGDWPSLTLVICARPEGVSLTLQAPPEQKKRLQQTIGALRRHFGPDAMPPDCSGLPHYVGMLLQLQGWMLGTAESCTGGAIAAAVTDVPGASQWFAATLVTYTNRSKQELLGVSRETLDRCGAVSEETVSEMVRGLCRVLGVEAGIAVSGIAGPTGDTPEKPLGTVCVATRTPAGERVATYIFKGDRNTVRQRAVAGALNQLRRDIPPAHGGVAAP